MQQIFYRADLVRINMQARLTNTNNYPGPIVAQWPPGGFVSDYFSRSVFFHFRHSDHARARLIANYPTLMMLLLAERPLAKRCAAPRRAEMNVERKWGNIAWSRHVGLFDFLSCSFPSTFHRAVYLIWPPLLRPLPFHELRRDFQLAQSVHLREFI